MLHGPLCQICPVVYIIVFLNPLTSESNLVAPQFVAISYLAERPAVRSGFVLFFHVWLDGVYGPLHTCSWLRAWKQSRKAHLVLKLRSAKQSEENANRPFALSCIYLLHRNVTLTLESRRIFLQWFHKLCSCEPHHTPWPCLTLQPQISIYFIWMVCDKPTQSNTCIGFEIIRNFHYFYK